MRCEIFDESSRVPLKQNTGTQVGPEISIIGTNVDPISKLECYEDNYCVQYESDKDRAAVDQEVQTERPYEVENESKLADVGSTERIGNNLRKQMLHSSTSEFTAKKVSSAMSRNIRIESGNNLHSTKCSTCNINKLHKYVFTRDGSRRRSLSYEYLKNQESKCAKVGCKRCLARGIMHPTSVTKELQILVNMSKSSSFFHSGEIIAEVVGEHATSTK